jgi:hypothetical protein
MPSYGRATILHWIVWDVAEDKMKATYDRRDLKTPPVSWVSDERKKELNMKLEATRRLFSIDVFQNAGARLADWEPYDAARYGKVPVFIEPQWNAIKAAGASVMQQMAAALMAGIGGFDEARRLGAPKRVIVYRAKKHGLARNNNKEAKARAAAATGATPKKRTRKEAGVGKKEPPAKRARKTKETKKEEEEIAPTLILLDQDDEEGQGVPESMSSISRLASIAPSRPRPMPTLIRNPLPPPRALPPAAPPAPIVLSNGERVAPEYDDRKETSTDLCRRFLEQHGDFSALRFFEHVIREYNRDKKREVKPDDLADAYLIALHQAEEEAKAAAEVRGMPKLGGKQ